VLFKGAIVPEKVKVILNINGGRLAGEAKMALIEKAMHTVGLDYELSPTSSAVDGCNVAQQAARDGWPIIVAAGGDGTINGVVNGLMRAAGMEQTSRLGIIPLGTANDLADMLSLPRDVIAACRRLAASNTRLIDVGIVNDHYFVNNSAVGLEPVVSMEHERIRYISGDIRYILAALKGISQAQTWHMHLTWDTGIYDGPITLVSIGNSRRTGGSFYMTPQAALDDGLLDFIYAFGMSRWQMLKLLPKTFKGEHIRHPLVSYLQTKSLSIISSPPTPIQADGEVIAKQATEIHYQIIPKKLRVII
jgi:diacylglycerol kinase (ATP)